MITTSSVSNQNAAHIMAERYIDQYQAAVLKDLRRFRIAWAEATGGDLSEVKVDLGLLFDDLERIIKQEPGR